MLCGTAIAYCCPDRAATATSEFQPAVSPFPPSLRIEPYEGGIDRELVEELEPETEGELVAQTLLIFFRYSPDLSSPLPQSGIVTFRSTLEDGISTVELGKMAISPTGIARLDLHQRQPISIAVEGDEFEAYEAELEPQVCEVAEYLVFLSPRPAIIDVRIRSEIALTKPRVAIQESKTSGVVPLLTGQWKYVDAISPADSAEVSFSVAPFKQYYLCLILDSGLLAVPAITVDSLDIGESRQIDIQLGEKDLNVIRISVNATVTVQNADATATLGIFSQNGLVAGREITFALQRGMGEVNILLPATGGGCRIVYYDGFSSPVQLSLEVSREVEVHSVQGGLVEMINDVLFIRPCEPHLLRIPKVFKGTVVNPSAISQRLTGGRRRLRVNTRIVEQEMIEILGLGENSRAIRINGVDYESDALRRQSVLASTCVEHEVLVGLYLTQPVSGVVLKVIPDGSVVEYFLESFSASAGGESNFVLSGALPAGTSSWEALSLPDGDAVGWGSITVSQEGQRIALRGH